MRAPKFYLNTVLSETQHEPEPALQFTPAGSVTSAPAKHAGVPNAPPRRDGLHAAAKWARGHTLHRRLGQRNR